MNCSLLLDSGFKYALKVTDFPCVVVFCSMTFTTGCYTAAILCVGGSYCHTSLIPFNTVFPLPDKLPRVPTPGYSAKNSNLIVADCVMTVKMPTSKPHNRFNRQVQRGFLRKFTILFIWRAIV